jgi:hypothetical protein
MKNKQTQAYQDEKSMRIPSLLIYFNLFIAKDYLCLMKFPCGNAVHKQIIRPQDFKTLSLRFVVFYGAFSCRRSAKCQPSSFILASS